ncbi:5-oxoprolinase subunit C family protein [Pseudoneobacillus sp. C159]
MGALIEKPGLLTTVQDLGRFGYQRDGIIVSGPMDSLSMRLANILVGNSEKDAVLEITLIGPTILFLVDTIIAICGGDLSPTINNNFCNLNKPLIVKKGDCLAFGPNKKGSRCYIAFKGGINVNKVLGSRSTCLPARFGGFNGRPLEKGDRLPIKQTIQEITSNWRLSPRFKNILFNRDPIRFIKGRHYHLFTNESLHKFQASAFTVTKDANRIGYRLLGPELNLLKPQELLTEGVTFGSVQVPANGQPIILMADHQTTGGYPKIAQICSVDLPRLAQLKPGDDIYFTEISFQKAQLLVIEREKELSLIKRMVTEKWSKGRI